MRSATACGCDTYTPTRDDAFDLAFTDTHVDMGHDVIQDYLYNFSFQANP